MTKPDQPQNHSIGSITDETDGREPYESPRLESEELFEVLALACGKVQPTNFNCQRLNRAS
jgi:hypothetical protein